MTVEVSISPTQFRRYAALLHAAAGCPYTPGDKVAYGKDGRLFSTNMRLLACWEIPGAFQKRPHFYFTQELKEKASAPVDGKEVKIFFGSTMLDLPPMRGCKFERRIRGAINLPVEIPDLDYLFRRPPACRAKVQSKPLLDALKAEAEVRDWVSTVGDRSAPVRIVVYPSRIHIASWNGQRKYDIPRLDAGPAPWRPDEVVIVGPVWLDAAKGKDLWRPFARTFELALWPARDTFALQLVGKQFYVMQAPLDPADYEAEFVGERNHPYRYREEVEATS